MSTILIIYLVLSAACLVVSAIVGYVRAKQLEVFTKHLEDGNISIDAALKELDAQDAANKATPAGEVENA